MKNFFRLFPQIILTLLIGALPLFASETQEDPRLSAAKMAGNVCELPNGDIRAVSNDPEILSLVTEINARRLETYEDIAQKRGISIDLVRQFAAQKIAQRHPEHDYMCH